MKKKDKLTWTEIYRSSGYLLEDETIPEALIKLAKVTGILVGSAVVIGLVLGLILKLPK